MGEAPTEDDIYLVPMDLVIEIFFSKMNEFEVYGTSVALQVRQSGATNGL